MIGAARLIKWRLPILPGARVIVAVSGGQDSVALLHAMIDAGYDAIAAHYEHGIRGEASLADAAFVKELCDDLCVKCYIDHGDATAYAKRLGLSLEDAARQLRYGFLMAIADEHNVDRIATGHHMQDQAETMLMRAFRGCSPDALAGIWPTNGRIIRPLLYTTHDEIVDFMRDKPWREDATNAEPIATRNRVRHAIMPTVVREFPGAVPALNRLSIIARRDEEYFMRMVESILSDALEITPLGARLSLNKDADDAINGRVYAKAAQEAGLMPDFTHIDALLNGATRVETIGGAIERGHLHLHFIRQKPQPAAISITRRAVESRGESGDCTQFIDADIAKDALSRYRQPGDVIRPLGGCGTKKLSDYLIDRKIDRTCRDYIPLMVIGNRVMWAVGVGISEDVAIRRHTTRIERWDYADNIWWK